MVTAGARTIHPSGPAARPHRRGARDPGKNPPSARSVQYVLGRYTGL